MSIAGVGLSRGVVAVTLGMGANLCAVGSSWVGRRPLLSGCGCLGL